MKSIEHNYQYHLKKPSDINEHLSTLYKYASECDSVFETGVRGCISSWALSNGLLHNKNTASKPCLFMNDINECDIHNLLLLTKDLPIIIKYEWKNNLEFGIGL